MPLGDPPYGTCVTCGQSGSYHEHATYPGGIGRPIAKPNESGQDVLPKTVPFLLKRVGEQSLEIEKRGRKPHVLLLGKIWWTPIARWTADLGGEVRLSLTLLGLPIVWVDEDDTVEVR